VYISFLDHIIENQTQVRGVPDGFNTESLIAYPPEPDDLSKPEVEIKGGLRALKDQCLKITSNNEEVG
jgi:hypothetical protein